MFAIISVVLLYVYVIVVMFVSLFVHALARLVTRWLASLVATIACPLPRMPSSLSIIYYTLPQLLFLYWILVSGLHFVYKIFSYWTHFVFAIIIVHLWAYALFNANCICPHLFCVKGCLTQMRRAWTDSAPAKTIILYVYWKSCRAIKNVCLILMFKHTF